MLDMSQRTRDIAHAVRAIRKERGLSARAVAELVTARGFRLERNTIANLETGRRESISVDELVALHEVLNLPLAALLGVPIVPECSRCDAVAEALARHG